MVERDGKFSADGPVMKHIYRIDVSQATDVSGDFNSLDGLLINGKSLEANTWEQLSTAGIVPVKKMLAVDLVTALGDYPHDKLEGIWLINGNTMGVLNDDDFAVWSDATKKIRQKTLSPNNGTVINGNRLYIVNF